MIRLRIAALVSVRLVVGALLVVAFVPVAALSWLYNRAGSSKARLEAKLTERRFRAFVGRIVGGP